MSDKRLHPRPAGTPVPPADATAQLLRQAHDLGLTEPFQPAGPPAQASVRRPTVAGPAQVVRAPVPSSAAAVRDHNRHPPGPGRAEDENEGPLLYGLMATYWLTVPAGSGPPPSTIRFTGRRDGAPASAPADFIRELPVPALPPAAGRVALSTRMVGLPQGTWNVRGEPSSAMPASAEGQIQEQVTTSRLYPMISAPGVHPFAWPLLVLLGIVLALSVQSLLVRRGGGDVSTAVSIGIASTVVGYFSAKAYYMVQHRVGPRRFVQAGTCIQGFLLGSFATLALLALAVDVPVATLMDRTAPGVLFAMALARPGCWLGGCCAGRPTGSAWGLWSSDRVVGVRRLPVQLYEATLALAVAGLALGFLLVGLSQPSGAVTAVAVGSYTVGRQLLFPLRSEPRRTSAGRRAVLLVSLLIVLGSLIALLLG